MDDGLGVGVEVEVRDGRGWRGGADAEKGAAAVAKHEKGPRYGGEGEGGYGGGDGGGR